MKRVMIILFKSSFFPIKSCLYLIFFQFWETLSYFAKKGTIACRPTHTQKKNQMDRKVMEKWTLSINLFMQTTQRNKKFSKNSDYFFCYEWKCKASEVVSVYVCQNKTPTKYFKQCFIYMTIKFYSHTLILLTITVYNSFFCI